MERFKEETGDFGSSGSRSIDFEQQQKEQFENPFFRTFDIYMRGQLFTEKQPTSPLR